MMWNGTRWKKIMCFAAHRGTLSELRSACEVTAAAFLCFYFTVGAHCSLRAADPTALLQDGSLKGHLLLHLVSGVVCPR